MKKEFLLTLATLAFPIAASAASDIVINFDDKSLNDTIYIQYASISNLLNAKSQRDIKFETDTLIVKGGTVTTPVFQGADCKYNLALGKNAVISFYTSPGETLDINIKSLDPLRYTVYGSELMNGLTEIMLNQQPILDEYKLLQDGLKTDVTAEDLQKRYIKVNTDFIEAHPSSPASILALLDLNGQTFIDYFGRLNSELKNHILYSLADSRLKRVEHDLQAEKIRDELSSGHKTAPDFTLPNLEGKMVSLSEFKGKWVILDFWGSWCRWCIKGFPELKEAYNKYNDKLEVIGVDCGEPEENWKAGVAKHELPWVNLYNTEKDALLERYGVQGFPTKVIINPEGQIVNITSGDNPDFYNTLSSFIEGK